MRDNIRNFGGDPEEVTLWGQSAGAMSVAYHLTKQESEGLFNKVRLIYVVLFTVADPALASYTVHIFFSRSGTKSKGPSSY